MRYSHFGKFIEAQLENAKEEHGYQYAILPIDIFQKADDKAHKQITWRIEIWHPEKTLTTGESNKLLDKISTEARKEFNAERV
jgi:phenylalanyl-tRNA synthetase beta subunit